MLIQENVSPEWNRKSIIFIHGIGRQPAEFAAPLQKRLHDVDPALAEASLWHAVAYDDVNDAMDAKVIEFNGALQKGGADSIQAVGADFVVDLINFLFATDPYHWITNTTRKALQEVVQAGIDRGVPQDEHEIHVIAHSLGTVVAYEALHSILTDPQVLGLSSGFRVQTLFTAGSPIAFIKANESRIPCVNEDFYLREGPIERPIRLNKITKRKQSNIMEWINLRQRFDPVGSLVPLTPSGTGGAVSQDRVFDAFHTGPNPHDFQNYLAEFGPLIMEMVRG